MKLKPYILITCEHADYKIPSFIKSKLPDLYNSKILSQSHQAYDKYAYEFALNMKNEFKDLGFKSDLISYPYTRLILDANRTKKNPGFFSKLSVFLTSSELKKVEKEYDQYVDKCKSMIKKNMGNRDVYIFSVHSFTPIYKGKKRKTDVGLLFRTKIKKELALASSLQKELKKTDSKVSIHKNLPYRGHTDCFSNLILDQHLKNKNINGLFFELNQDYIKSNLKPKSIQMTKTLKKIITNLV